MRAFGYRADDEDSEELVSLKEVTLQCNADDLRRLANFLQQVLKEREAMGALQGEDWHEHLRDRDKTWTTQESDLILYFRA